MGECFGNYKDYTDAAAAAKSLQSCPTLCNPIDGSPPGSPVPGILQARTLSGLPFPSPMQESEKWKWSRSVVPDSLRPHGPQPTRLLCPRIFQARVLEWVAFAFSIQMSGKCKNKFLYTVQFSHWVVYDSLRPHGLQNARLPCPSPTPGVYSNSCLLSQWCHPAISSSVIPFSSCPLSFPATGSFPVSQLFTSAGQNIGVSASASVLQKNTQDWSPSGWTRWISLQSKGFSRVFFNTTVQKHQFFCAQLSL